MVGPRINGGGGGGPEKEDDEDGRPRDRTRTTRPGVIDATRPPPTRPEPEPEVEETDRPGEIDATRPPRTEPEPEPEVEETDRPGEIDATRPPRTEPEPEPEPDPGTTGPPQTDPEPKPEPEPDATGPPHGVEQFREDGPTDAGPDPRRVPPERDRTREAERLERSVEPGLEHTADEPWMRDQAQDLQQQAIDDYGWIDDEDHVRVVFGEEDDTLVVEETAPGRRRGMAHHLTDEYGQDVAPEDVVTGPTGIDADATVRELVRRQAVEEHDWATTGEDVDVVYDEEEDVFFARPSEEGLRRQAAEEHDWATTGEDVDVVYDEEEDMFFAEPVGEGLRRQAAQQFSEAYGTDVEPEDIVMGEGGDVDAEATERSIVARLMSEDMGRNIGPGDIQLSGDNWTLTHDAEARLMAERLDAQTTADVTADDLAFTDPAIEDGVIPADREPQFRWVLGDDAQQRIETQLGQQAIMLEQANVPRGRGTIPTGQGPEDPPGHEPPGEDVPTTEEHFEEERQRPPGATTRETAPAHTYDIEDGEAIVDTGDTIMERAVERARVEPTPHAGLSLEGDALDERAEQERVFAERADTGLRRLSEGELPTRAEAGAMLFHGGSIAGHATEIAGRDIAEASPTRGMGPQIGREEQLGDVPGEVAAYLVGGSGMAVSAPAQFPATFAAGGGISPGEDAPEWQQELAEGVDYVTPVPLTHERDEAFETTPTEVQGGTAAATRRFGESHAEMFRDYPLSSTLALGAPAAARAGPAGVRGYRAAEGSPDSIAFQAGAATRTRPGQRQRLDFWADDRGMASPTFARQRQRQRDRPTEADATDTTTITASDIASIEAAADPTRGGRFGPQGTSPTRGPRERQRTRPTDRLDDPVTTTPGGWRTVRTEVQTADPALRGRELGREVTHVDMRDAVTFQDAAGRRRVAGMPEAAGLLGRAQEPRVTERDAGFERAMEDLSVVGALDFGQRSLDASRAAETEIGQHAIRPGIRAGERETGEPRTVHDTTIDVSDDITRRPGEDVGQLPVQRPAVDQRPGTMPDVASRQRPFWRQRMRTRLSRPGRTRRRHRPPPPPPGRTPRKRRRRRRRREDDEEGREPRRLDWDMGVSGDDVLSPGWITATFAGFAGVNFLRAAERTPEDGLEPAAPLLGEFMPQFDPGEREAFDETLDFFGLGEEGWV